MIKCTFENGDETSLRHIAVNAMVVKTNQILMGLRGTFHGKPIAESGKWGLIGGYFERDETMIAAIQREVMEETGWTIKNIQLFRINDNPQRPREDKQNVDMVFIAEADTQIGSSDEEVTQLQWFELDHLPPRDLIAFDHAEDIDLYLKYRHAPFTLPLFGES